MTKHRHNDYGNKMPHLDFKYDDDFYPDDSQLPDPQLNPNIFGARVSIDKVGVTGVDLPMKFLRRDGSVQELHVKASLYGSLDDPNAKGLNLSRFPILMHEKVADHMSLEGIKNVLDILATKQNSKHVYCKLRFKYPWVQEALRTRKELPDDAPARDVFKVVEGVKLSHDKMLGYIFYDCILEGQLHEGEHRFYLTVSTSIHRRVPARSNSHKMRQKREARLRMGTHNEVWQGSPFGLIQTKLYGSKTS